TGPDRSRPGDDAGAAGICLRHLRDGGAVSDRRLVDGPGHVVDLALDRRYPRPQPGHVLAVRGAGRASRDDRRSRRGVPMSTLELLPTEWQTLNAEPAKVV